MKINEITQLLNAKIICGHEYIDHPIKHGFASDLMSDVLTIDTDCILLITGLCNLQTIRTAEMADIQCILFVRDKKASPEMIAIAEENHMVLMECSFSLFNAVGILYQSGLKPVY